MRFVAPIKRIDTAKGHHYVDANGARVPGVTTVIDQGKPKPALINWSANATAEAAVDRWDELATLTPSKRLDALKKARYEERDAAARRGTEVHAIGEKLVAGEAVDVPTELLGHAESYAKLLDDFKVEPVHVEFGIASYRHGYAGSGDLIAYFTLPRIGRKLLLVDLKTNKSGIFPETVLQLSAYQFAEVLLADDQHDERPMPEVDGSAAVHITPNGAELIPVTTNEATFRTFLYVMQVAEFEKSGKDLLGLPIRPESDVRYRLVREDAS